jgi:hypothetical protein
MFCAFVWLIDVMPTTSPRSFGAPVAAFDNEKANARAFRRALPNSIVVRLRTTSQRGDIGGLGHVTVINDFRPLASR